MRSEEHGEYFNALYDSRYEANYMEKHHGVESKKVKDTLAQIPTHIRSILDYGCGQGGWTELLSTMFPDSIITGVDISKTAIEKAKERFPGARYRFCLLDGNKAFFKDKSFDLIFSYHVLEHVHNIQATVYDMCRLARKEGFLAVFLPCGNEGSFLEKIVNLTEGGMERSVTGEIRFHFEDSGHLRRTKSEEILDLFIGYDASIFKEFYSGQLWGGIHQINAKLVKTIFDSSRAINKTAQVKLHIFKCLFGILSLLVRINARNLSSRLMNFGPFPNIFLLLCLIPLKTVAFFIAQTLDALELFEWRHQRYNRSASSQYLLFRKRVHKV